MWAWVGEANLGCGGRTNPWVFRLRSGVEAIAYQPGILDNLDIADRQTRVEKEEGHEQSGEWCFSMHLRSVNPRDTTLASGLLRVAGVSLRFSCQGPLFSFPYTPYIYADCRGSKRGEEEEEEEEEVCRKGGAKNVNAVRNRSFFASRSALSSVVLYHLEPSLLLVLHFIINRCFFLRFWRSERRRRRR